MSKHSHEIIHQLWDDADGTRIEIGPDRDSLGLTEIRFFYETGCINRSIALADEQLDFVIKVPTGIKTERVKPTGPTPREIAIYHK